MTTETHWNTAYENGDDGASWFQSSPERSLDHLRGLGLSEDTGIIDVGGGSSSLAAELVADGWKDVTVLDISAAALEIARTRLGEQAEQVSWITADLLTWRPERTYDVWHDRAVLHFFVEPEQQRAYRRSPPQDASSRRSRHPGSIRSGRA